MQLTCTFRTSCWLISVAMKTLPRDGRDSQRKNQTAGVTRQPYHAEQSTLKSGRAGGLDFCAGRPILRSTGPILRSNANRKQARMERHNELQSPAAGSLRALGSRLLHAEHPLLRIPILLGTALGLALGLTRFILAIRENLQAPPSGLNASLFLAAIVGGAAVLIVLFSAAVGSFIGLLLEAGYGRWRTRARSRLL